MKKSLFKMVVMLASLVLSSSLVFAAPKKAVVDTEVVFVDMHGNVNLAIKTNMFAIKGFGASDIVNVKVGNHSFSAPVVKDYSDVDAGKYLVRLNGEEVSLAINLGNLAEAVEAKVGTPVTISMKERYGYLTTYQLRLLKKSDDRESFASDEVFADFREVRLGGIKEGRLFRCTSPVALDSRSDYAAKLLEENNVTAVINLKDTEEEYLAREGTSPYYRKLYDEGKVLFVSMGASFASEGFYPKIRELLEFIESHPEDRICVHGREGRNRTGYVVAIISALCGASIEDINNDYMLSYTNVYGVKKGRQQYDEIAHAIPYMFSTMNNGKLVKEGKLKGVTEKYLKTSVGLTQSQIDSIVKTLK